MCSLHLYWYNDMFSTLQVPKGRKPCHSLHSQKLKSNWRGFPGGSVVKNLPANARDWVQSLIQEDLLEKEMATHSSILAWRIPRTKEPGGLQSMASQRIGGNWATSLVAQLVKNLPAMQATWVWSLDLEDPLEKGMATLSSILAWRIPWIATASCL